MVVKKGEIHKKKLTSVANLARKQDRKSLQSGTILKKSFSQGTRLHRH
jgi:hypothetical protein